MTTRYVAILRAINLGAHNRISMKDLQRLFADLGSSEKFGIWGPMVALHALAGEDGSLVNALSMSGARVDVQGQSQGAVENAADALIGKVLTPP